MEPEPAGTLLAHNLRTYRKAALLSQNQLACKAGMSRSYICGIEQSHFRASWAGILRLANALEIAPMLLFAPTIQSFEADEAYQQLLRPSASQLVNFVAENRAAFQVGDSAIMVGTTHGLEIHLLNR